MSAFVNRLLGRRSVAAWTVIGGVSGFAALLVAVCTLALAGRTVPQSSGNGGLPAAPPSTGAAATSPKVQATSPTLEASGRGEESMVYLDQVEPVEGADAFPGEYTAGPRVLNRTTYPRSLTMKFDYNCQHILSFNVNREYRYLRATIGLADTAETGADAVFSVTGDGRELFNSGEVKLGDTRPIEVPIGNVFRLTLTISDVCSVRADATWGDARLVK
jgi:NPCBM/NEW2 domain